MKTQLLSLMVFTSLFCHGLIASATDPQLSDDSAVLITLDPAPAEQQVPALEASDIPGNEELNLVYDPNKLPVADQVPKSKEQWFAELRAELEAAKDNTKLHIPIAPSTELQIEKLDSLPEDALNTFLNKKTMFLTKFAKTMSFLRLKPKYINKAMNEINAKFYESYKAVARSNALSSYFMLSGSFGVALPTKIAEKLRATKYGKFIPKSGGFYYLLGLGGAIVRKKLDTGKQAFFFEVFMDIEHLEKTLTGLVDVSGAMTAGVIYEFREGDFASQKNRTSYGGASGVYRTGENQFGWAGSLGASIPPGIGAFLVFSDTTTRVYLMRLDLTKRFYAKGFVTFPAFQMIKTFVKYYSSVTAERISNHWNGRISCEKAL